MILLPPYRTKGKKKNLESYISPKTEASKSDTMYLYTINWNLQRSVK